MRFKKIRLFEYPSRKSKIENNKIIESIKHYSLKLLHSKFVSHWIRWFDLNDTAKNTSTASARGQSVKVFFKIFAICSFAVKNENCVDFCPQIKEYQRPYFRGVTPIVTSLKCQSKNWLHPLIHMTKSTLLLRFQVDRIRNKGVWSEKAGNWKVPRVSTWDLSPDSKRNWFFLAWFHPVSRC